MEIRDLLAEDGRRELTVIHPDNSLREAARIMNSHNIGSLVVCSKERKIVGIISERDLLRAISDFDKGKRSEKPWSGAPAWRRERTRPTMTECDSIG